jgi:hypothetical protein
MAPFLFLLMLLMGSCGKNNSSDPDAYFFEFDFNNHFSLESTGEMLQTDKGYIDTAFEWVSAHIHLSDGSIGDTLLTSCGNWFYEENPTSTVEIWFPQGTIEDGIYEFSKTESVNDFQIVIKRNLSFGPSFELGNQVSINSIQNQDLIAQGYTGFNNGNSYDVTQAFIKIENTNSSASMIRYVIQTENGEMIRGSYSGNLEHFKRIQSEGDCD